MSDRTISYYDPRIDLDKPPTQQINTAEFINLLQSAGHITINGIATDPLQAETKIDRSDPSAKVEIHSAIGTFQIPFNEFKLACGNPELPFSEPGNFYRPKAHIQVTHDDQGNPVLNLDGMKYEKHPDNGMFLNADKVVHGVLSGDQIIFDETK